MRRGGGKEVFISDRIHESDDLDAVGEGEVLFRYRAGGDAADGFAGGAPAAAAGGFDAVFHLVGVVCVGGAGVLVHCAVAVVFWSLVFVANAQADRGTESDAEFGAGLDFNFVFFVAGGGEGALAGAAPGHLGLDVGFCEGKARGAAIDDAADGEAVGFAIAEREVLVLLRSCNWMKAHVVTRKYCPKVDMFNRGKDLRSG